MMKRSTPITLLALALTCACTGELVVEDELGGGAGEEVRGADAGTDTPDAPPPVNLLAQEYFYEYVQPLLLGARPKGACALCHQGTSTTNGPIFMGASQVENYQALIADTSLIGPDPGSSRLLTRGDHAGNSFCSGLGVPYNQCDKNEFAVLSEWVRLQNQ